MDHQLYLTEAEARTYYTGDDRAHDFDHVLRVTQMAVHLAAAEGADPTVVRLAALLHDVPAADLSRLAHQVLSVRRQPTRNTQASILDTQDDACKSSRTHARRDHHLAAADFARQLLAERGLEIERIGNVVHCIEAHRFRDQSIQPQTLEARCLYDADKLDSIGAIGIGRAFAYAGRHHNRLWTNPWRDTPPAAQKPTGADYTPVHEFVYKLQKLSATLYTATARRIAAQRHTFLHAFFDQLDAEMQGIR